MQHCRSWPARIAAVALTFTAWSLLPYATAQRPPAQPNAAEILHRMQKLNVLGSVLYIVAHPDDENTRLITWLANGKKVRTGNLSLTRGDGGQNLIGPELGDALGIIRTQELLEARRIDGGEQFFTRAVDFGYSKSAEESFAKWGKQEVLSDVVRVIRTFRPDIIITRFSTEPGTTHGHHTASAILAHEAFDLAGDPNAFPEQLQQGLEVWQPRRLFFNGSSWWRRDLSEHAKNDPDWFTVDVGGYDPLLGLSYTEIAGRSRSMHKSQGFGAAETRGESLEYLKFEKGDRPKTRDIFEGIDMTWGRVKGGDVIQARIDKVLSSYAPTCPSCGLDNVKALRSDVLQNGGGGRVGDPERHYQQAKLREIDQIILDMCGIVVEPTLSRAMLSSGEFMTVDLSVTNRSDLEVKTDVIKVGPSAGGLLSLDVRDTLVGSNRTVTLTRNDGGSNKIDEPYWMQDRSSGTSALHAISDRRLIGRPVQSQSLVQRCHIHIEDAMIEVGRPVFHKWVDRVAGERIRPVYVTPVASVIPKVNNLISRGGTQTIEVEVEALTDSLSGQLNITLPPGWGTTKDIKSVNIPKRNERQTFTFQLMPGDKAEAGAARFEFVGPKGKADRTLHEIDYPHIMPQVYYTPAEVKLVPLDVTTTAQRVGYVKGAGDDVPQAIQQLGVTVDFIEPATAQLDDLKNYDAIVTGIRAYNATKGMKELHPLLLRYVEEGGTLVVQYNTTPRFGLSGVTDFQIDPETFGPYPIKLTRERVTVEEAPPTFLDPKHPLLNTPNKITAADFDGWVQERGLYFAGERDPRYTAPIAWNDPGEDPLDGALIACDHGKGRFIYTGISFFRQLPAGVPGAYRLFANLISKKED